MTKFHRIIIITSIILLLSPHPGIHSAYCSESGDEDKGKWVLYHTFIGEGGENVCEDGTRCEGSFDRWTADETSLTYHSRHLDHWGEEDFTNAKFEFTLPEFPEELIPGEKDVNVTATGKASGYMRAEYFVSSLEIWGDGISLKGYISTGEEVWGYLGPRMTVDVNWEWWNGEEWVVTETENPASETLTIVFDVPMGSEGAEFGITAGIVGGIDAGVEWVYRFEEPEEKPPLSVSITELYEDDPEGKKYFHGSVTAAIDGSTEYISGATVEYETDLPGLSGGQTTTDSVGDYDIVLNIPEDTPSDEYTLYVTAEKEGYEDGSAEITFTVQVPKLEVTGTFNKDHSILYGYVTVTVDGATDNIEGAFVEYDIDVPGINSGQIKTDSGGGFRLWIPEDTPENNYTLTATAKKEGYEDGSGEITFTIEIPKLKIGGWFDKTDSVFNGMVTAKIDETYEKIRGALVEYETNVPGVSQGSTFTDSKGLFAIPIPKDTTPDDYTFTITASKREYKDGSAEITFTVLSESEIEEKEEKGDPDIPGFPLNSITYALLLSSIILITTRRRASIN